MSEGGSHDVNSLQGFCHDLHVPPMERGRWNETEDKGSMAPDGLNWRLEESRQ
jgi:hypothetical protein